MDELKDDIKDTRNEVTISQLENRVTKIINDIETWNIELKQALSGTPNNESLLWIGLGQAGGQILRECLMYSVTNLSDARCSALLTALGVGSRDKKNVYQNIKNIYSKDSKVKIKRKKNYKICLMKRCTCCHKPGEEIDKLVTKDQPGYFFGVMIFQEKNQVKLLELEEMY